MTTDHSTSFGSVRDRDLAPTTDFAAQLQDQTVAEREVFTGYYASSGRLDNGDLIEMTLAEERAVGSTSKTLCVYIALNGQCNRRRYELAGATADLADWLRGRHLGWESKCTRLTPGAAEILAGLYADLEQAGAGRSARTELTAPGAWRLTERSQVGECK